MHRNSFLSERRALYSCLGDMLREDTLRPITAEWATPRAGKQIVRGATETFS